MTGLKKLLLLKMMGSDTEKNYFDPSEVVRKDYYFLNDNGVEQTSSASGYTTNLTPLDANTAYTISGTIVTGYDTWRLYFYDTSGNWIKRSGAINATSMPYTFTTPENCGYIAIQYPVSTVDFSTIKITKG